MQTDRFVTLPAHDQGTGIHSTHVVDLSAIAMLTAIPASPKHPGFLVLTVDGGATFAVDLSRGYTDQDGEKVEADAAFEILADAWRQARTG